MRLTFPDRDVASDRQPCIAMTDIDAAAAAAACPASASLRGIVPAGFAVLNYRIACDNHLAAVVEDAAAPACRGAAAYLDAVIYDALCA